MSRPLSKQQKQSRSQSESAKYLTPNSFNKYSKINFRNIDKHLKKINNIKYFIIGVNDTSNNNNINDYLQNKLCLKSLLNLKKYTFNDSDFSNSERETEKSFQGEEIKVKKSSNQLDPHGYFPEGYSLKVYKQTNLYKNRYQIQTRNLKNTIKKIQVNEKSPHFIDLNNQMKKNNIENTIGIEEYRLLNSKKIDKFVNKTLNIKNILTPKQFRKKNNKFRLKKKSNNYNFFNSYNKKFSLRPFIIDNDNINKYMCSNGTQTIDKNKENEDENKLKKNFSVKEMKFEMINIPKKMDNNIFIRSYKKSINKYLKEYANKYNKHTKLTHSCFSAKNRSSKNHDINHLKNLIGSSLKFSFYNPDDERLQIFNKNNLP